MQQTHFAARLRVPSCHFVVNPHPQGFVLLRASSWSNLRRKASCSFVSLRGKSKLNRKARTPLAVRPSPRNMFFNMFPQNFPQNPWPPRKKPPSLHTEPQRAAPHSEARKQHFPFQPPKRTKKKGNNLKRQELEIQRPRHSHGKLPRKFPQTFLPFFLAGTAEVRTFALAKRK